LHRAMLVGVLRAYKRRAEANVPLTEHDARSWSPSAP
jgi:hypothetical protein